MRITYDDIRKRINGLSSNKRPTLINMQEAMLYTKEGKFCKENAVNAIKHLETLSEDIDTAYVKALDIFDEICENCNPATIKTSSEVLLEISKKVRDHKSLERSIKQRLGRQDNKARNQLDDIDSEINDKIKAAINTDSQMSAPTLPAPVAINTPGAAAAKQEAYQALYAECVKFIECDRILENYNSISRRFNIDKIINEIKSDYDCKYACVEIASCIDTYDIPFKNKYNAAIETAVYAFDKHYMNYPRKNILESVTDYFIFSGGLGLDQIPELQQVLNKTVVLDEYDKSGIEALLGDDQPLPTIEAPQSVDEAVLSYDGDSFFDEAITPTVKSFVKDKSKEVKAAAGELKKSAGEGKDLAKERMEVDQMMDAFRKDCMKNKDNVDNVSKFKAILTKLYSKNPLQLANNLGNVFGVIRTIFIVSSIGINPILGLLTAFTDQMLKIHFGRKQYAQVIAAYNKEIASVEGKLKTAKEGAYKERYEKYLKALQADKEKLEANESEIYTDKENDEREKAKWDAELNNDFDDSEDDEDWDDDNFDEDGFDDEDWDDEDFEEAGVIAQIANIMEAINESLTNMIDPTPQGVVFSNVFRATNDSIDDITDFALTVPSVFNRYQLIECLTNYRNELRKSNPEHRNYIRIDCLNENIAKLKESVPVYASNTTRNALEYLTCLNEMVKIGSPSLVLEMDFTNNVKLALRNLKNSVVNLSDREKRLSSNIDVAANNMTKGIEVAMKTNAREKILKGNVMPSFSKCLKTALVAGAAWAINPAIATIGAVTAWATSKKMERKERLIVLDDLEIEIKMVDRYLKQAEENNDMEKIKQYEIVKRNLQRARTRVKYKTVAAGQKLPMDMNKEYRGIEDKYS